MDLQKLTEWVALLERRIDEQDELIEALTNIIEGQIDILGEQQEFINSFDNE